MHQEPDKQYLSGWLASIHLHTASRYLPASPRDPTWLCCKREDLALALNIHCCSYYFSWRSNLPEGVSVTMYCCLHWEQVIHIFIPLCGCHLYAILQREESQSASGLWFSLQSRIFSFSLIFVMNFIELGIRYVALLSMHDKNTLFRPPSGAEHNAFYFYIVLI